MIQHAQSTKECKASIFWAYLISCHFFSLLLYFFWNVNKKKRISLVIIVMQSNMPVVNMTCTLLFFFLHSFFLIAWCVLEFTVALCVCGPFHFNNSVHFFFRVYTSHKRVACYAQQQQNFVLFSSGFQMWDWFVVESRERSNNRMALLTVHNFYRSATPPKCG